jgi:hypothetical protein
MYVSSHLSNRTSVTEKVSPFTISKVNKKGKINHQRVHKRPDGTFEISIKYPDGKSKTIDSRVCEMHFWQQLTSTSSGLVSFFMFACAGWPVGWLHSHCGCWTRIRNRYVVCSVNLVMTLNMFCLACPGSRYKALFLQTKVEGYLSTDNDDD